MNFITDPSPHLNDLAGFVQDSPSSFHAAEKVARRLEDAGALRVDESLPYPSEPGAYVVVRDGAVAAWVVPENPAGAFRIVGSHTDSPGFRLKPNPQDSSVGYVRAQVEVYGGVLLNAWLDREIEFAGRVVDGNGKGRLVRTGPVGRIPQLAIHLDRAVTSEGLKLDKQRHTAPLLGLAGDVRDSFGADAVAWDLISADTQPPREFGLNGEFFASGRLDNLMSVHASLVAFEGLLHDAHLDSIPLLIANDHEEVGSATATGAAGPMLEEILDRIGIALGHDADQRHRALGESICVSADGAHAVHPNYPGEHDPGHHPHLNVGPVVKINANQRYATDAVGQALWTRWTRQAAEKTGQYIEVQTFVSANHKPCGSTIGPITATRLGIRTIDVGAPMLSMHSAREMTGSLDPWMLRAVLTEFWSAS